MIATRIFKLHVRTLLFEPEPGRRRAVCLDVNLCVDSTEAHVSDGELLVSLLEGVREACLVGEPVWVSTPPRVLVLAWHVAKKQHMEAIAAGLPYAGPTAAILFVDAARPVLPGEEL